MPGEPRPCVVVTTYARPDGLARLLDDLEREQPPGGLDVRVYDDATPNPDGATERRLLARGWSYRRAGANHGKRGWWRWWNAILEDLRRGAATLFYVLQDDMRLCERFFERSGTLWSAIEDRDRGSLYLHLSAERAELGSRCWTPVRAEPAGAVVRCGWVDCAAFMCDRALFAALGWRLEPIGERRWQRREHLSSGVGQQLSVRAHALGLGLYRVERSLTVHDGSPSLMNAAARGRWSMETVGFVDGDEAARRHAVRRPRAFASLASIPRRERALAHVVERLLEQVDALGVYLNGYARVPAFLRDERIEVVRSQQRGDRGDAGKFFWAGSIAGYHVVCDDDIDYPPDYVERLVAGIERHGRRAVVGFHGRLMTDEVVEYHRSRRLLHFARAQGADAAVHVLGTGVCGYHASAIRVWPKDFVAPNMADVWLALLGQRQRVPFVCLQREEGWLRELPGCREDSIYVRARRCAAAPDAAPSRETVAARAHGRWRLHEPAGGAAAVPAPPRPRGAGRAPSEPARPRQRRLVRVHVAGPRHSATLVLPARDHITETVQRSGTYYERDLLDAILARGAGGTYVDVGAHYGNHTAFFGLECGAERIVAIEPSPPAYAGLLETVAENGLHARVAAHRAAAHPSWRRVTVTALPWRARPGATARSNSGRVGVVPAAGDDAGAGVAPAAPLDELLDGVARVGLVKVSTEGTSAAVLASGSRMLRRDLPLVAAEAGSPPERRALRALMTSLGYREMPQPFCWTATWLWEPPALSR